MRDRLPTRLLAVSVFVLITTPMVVWATRPNPEVGSLPASIGELGPISPVVQAEGEPLISSGLGIPNVVVRSARLEDYRPPPHGARPVGLAIETIGVNPPVVPVGVEGGSKTVEVPGDVDTVGWYRFGPTPGGSGSAVLIGHVDSRVQGSGAFFRLRELGPDDVVTVQFADGTRSTFRVVARRSYPKSRLPGELFQRSGPSLLTLVTCGGAFDQATESYANNVVVFAVPVD